MSQTLVSKSFEDLKTPSAHVIIDHKVGVCVQLQLLFLFPSVLKYEIRGPDQRACNMPFIRSVRRGDDETPFSGDVVELRSLQVTGSFWGEAYGLWLTLQRCYSCTAWPKAQRHGNTMSFVSTILRMPRGECSGHV